ncbi:MAG: L,D-transpeptidase [Gammaproteobacteria bacterium]|nr:L,D-transpeptidase [Gammaproteobacteria bacterium]MDA7971695.1 L,D-transpeptidase [Gammaproteobacteria bacterium]MDA7989708.1 L,D-transpeptidase [Gammaproteobacteria bacterium]MDA7995014.1 L,D-transpeptidase [Gammaproteobacteria bacterium]MDA8007254.1 L,D-transpeptidase [Gammaproteobacteria bacterium]
MAARIHIDLARQRMTLYRGEDALARYPVSSAANGAGERNGSECTPRGRHVVRAMIGHGAPPGSVFVGRRPTGEIFTPEMRAKAPRRDWILTRILWLSGCEVGRNRLGEVDSMRRYIYIHGAPDDVDFGRPGSRGCIRMRGRDVVELFERVAPGTPVQIDG